MKHFFADAGLIIVVAAMAFGLVWVGYQAGQHQARFDARWECVRP